MIRKKKIVLRKLRGADLMCGCIIQCAMCLLEEGDGSQTCKKVEEGFHETVNSV